MNSDREKEREKGTIILDKASLLNVDSERERERGTTILDKAFHFSVRGRYYALDKADLTRNS